MKAKMKKSTPHSALRTPHSDDPEVALMLRVQCDDGAAIAELVQRYWTRIFARLYRQLGDRQEAEDRAQEVFLRLYRSRRSYRPRAKFSTWLFHIANNVARNALRTRRRHPSVPLGQLLQNEVADQVREDVLQRHWESPWRSLERAELAEQVRKGVAQLAERQRTALELHQFHDHTYSEVAAELDMSPQAAKSLLYRARSQLRSSLMPLLAD
jgi:RNA polymerase sigma-70 factor (ECF subfamily)